MLSVLLSLAAGQLLLPVAAGLPSSGSSGGQLPDGSRAPDSTALPDVSQYRALPGGRPKMWDAPEEYLGFLQEEMRVVAAAAFGLRLGQPDGPGGPDSGGWAPQKSVTEWVNLVAGRQRNAGKSQPETPNRMAKLAITQQSLAEFRDRANMLEKAYLIKDGQDNDWPYGTALRVPLQKVVRLANKLDVAARRDAQFTVAKDALYRYHNREFDSAQPGWNEDSYVKRLVEAADAMRLAGGEDFVIFATKRPGYASKTTLPWDVWAYDSNTLLSRSRLYTQLAAALPRVTPADVDQNINMNNLRGDLQKLADDDLRSYHARLLAERNKQVPAADKSFGRRLQEEGILLAARLRRKINYDVLPKDLVVDDI